MKIRFKNLIVSALLGLCLLGSNSFGAMVLVKRALTQQAYATYSVATPGNAGKMDFGTLNQRPYGPKLAGWAMGWSAQNSSANARIVFDSTDGVSFQNGSQETTCG